MVARAVARSELEQQREIPHPPLELLPVSSSCLFFWIRDRNRRPLSMATAARVESAERMASSSLVKPSPAPLVQDLNHADGAAEVVLERGRQHAGRAVPLSKDPNPSRSARRCRRHSVSQRLAGCARRYRRRRPTFMRIDRTCPPTTRRPHEFVTGLVEEVERGLGRLPPGLVSLFSDELERGSSRSSVVPSAMPTSRAPGHALLPPKRLSQAEDTIIAGQATRLYVGAHLQAIEPRTLPQIHSLTSSADAPEHLEREATVAVGSRA